jgi:hypothetical protein
VPASAKTFAFRCSSMQFGLKWCFRKLHGAAHLRMELQTRDGFVPDGTMLFFMRSCLAEYSNRGVPGSGVVGDYRPSFWKFSL